MQWHNTVLPAALLIAVSFLVAAEAQGAQGAYNSYYSEGDADPYPEVVMEILARVGQSLLRQRMQGQYAKRGLDLGFGRGYPAAQAAKGLIGQATANYPGGPGRRRREAPQA